MLLVVQLFDTHTGAMGRLGIVCRIPVRLCTAESLTEHRWARAPEGCRGRRTGSLFHVCAAQRDVCRAWLQPDRRTSRLRAERERHADEADGADHEERQVLVEREAGAGRACRRGKDGSSSHWRQRTEE